MHLDTTTLPCGPRQRIGDPTRTPATAATSDAGKAAAPEAAAPGAAVPGTAPDAAAPRPGRLRLGTDRGHAGGESGGSGDSGGRVALRGVDGDRRDRDGLAPPDRSRDNITNRGAEFSFEAMPPIRLLTVNSPTAQPPTTNHSTTNRPTTNRKSASLTRCASRSRAAAGH